MYGLVAITAFGGGAWLALSRMSTPLQLSATDALRTLRLPASSGTTQSMEQWKGKVLVINFWATWCAPCREEIPMFVRMQQELGGKGLQFIGISIDNADKTREFEKSFGINYPSLIGSFDTLEVSRRVGNSKGVLPFTVILDRKGAIVATELGGLKREKLEALIIPLL
jgi:thiol-disulfide isomerase/thioredoxin